MGNLTDLKIRALIRAGIPIVRSDGDGLSFTLSKNGTPTWILRYRINGKQKELTLGRYPEFSISAARQLANEKRAEVQRGVDVAYAKQKNKQDAALAWTFKKLAESYFEKCSGRLAKTTLSGRRQQLRDYVYTRIGNHPAAKITPRDIVEIVERSAKKSPHIAKLVLIAIREVFAHGLARHVIEFNPSAQIKARAIIGDKPPPRDRISLTDQELQAVLPALAQIGRSNELTVKILLGTCVRIGELVLAKWEEVDFSRNEWTIPAANAKTGREFIVPLTDLTATWFKELRELAFDSQFVLPIRQLHNGREGDAHMVPVTLNAALNRLAAILKDRCRRFTPHDLRSTARSHLGALGVPLLIAERCLNHSLGGLVAIYDKHDYMVERRNALQHWSNKIATLAEASHQNVIHLNRTAA